MCQKVPATIAIESNDAGNMTTTSQDILILLLPYLSPADSTSLFDLCLTPEVLNGRNNGIQKRGYKTLAKLVDGGKILVDSEIVVRKLDEMMDGLTPAAKKVALRWVK
jgi:ribosomal RNA-processing protein 12